MALSVAKLLSKHGTLMTSIFSRPALAQSNPDNEAEMKSFEVLQTLSNTNYSGRKFQQSLLKRTEKEISFELEMVSNDKKMSTACDLLIQTIGNENPPLKNACSEISKRHEMWEKSTAKFHDKLNTTLVNPLRSILSGHPHLDVSRVVYDYKNKQSEVASQKAEVEKRSAKMNADSKHKDENAVKLKEAEQKLFGLIHALDHMGNTSRSLIKTANREQQISILKSLVIFAEAKAGYFKQASQIFEQLSLEIRELENQSDVWSTSIERELNNFGSFGQGIQFDQDNQKEIKCFDPVSFSVPVSAQLSNGYDSSNLARSHSHSISQIQPHLLSYASSIPFTNLNEKSILSSQIDSSTNLESIPRTSFTGNQETKEYYHREKSLEYDSEIDSVDGNNEMFLSQDLSFYNSTLHSKSPYIPHYSAEMKKYENDELPDISEESKDSSDYEETMRPNGSERESERPMQSEAGDSEKWELSGSVIHSDHSAHSTHSIHSIHSQSTKSSSKRSKRSKVAKKSSDSVSMNGTVNDSIKNEDSAILSSKYLVIESDKQNAYRVENTETLTNKQDYIIPNRLEFYQTESRSNPDDQV